MYSPSTARFAAFCISVTLTATIGTAGTDPLRPLAPQLHVQPLCRLGTGKADASPSAINPPDGLAFTRDGLLLATDAMNHRVQIFDPCSGRHLGSLGGPRLFKGEITNILVLPDQGLLVNDETNNLVYRFSRIAGSAASFHVAGRSLLGKEGFRRLCGMACDSRKRVYVVDGLTGDVRRYLPDFRPDPSWPSPGRRSDSSRILRRAEGIAVYEPEGILFLASEWDGMIQAFSLETGKWLGFSLGQSAFAASTEGLAVIENYLLAIDEGADNPAARSPGHLLVFDLHRRLAGPAAGDGLVGSLGPYRSPDSVAVFPGTAEHPEPLVAVADQGSYQVLVYRWKDLYDAIAGTGEGALP